MRASTSTPPASGSRSRPTSRWRSRRSSRSSTRRRSTSPTASSGMFEDAQANPILADSVRGELIDTEIEIRSGPLGVLRRAASSGSASAGGCCSSSPAGHGRALGVLRDPSLGRLPRPGDHRHAPLPAAPRGARLGRAAQQHLEPARPRRRPRRRPGDRRLRPPAQRAADAAGDLRQLDLPRRTRHRPALGPHPDLHPHLPPLRRSTIRSATGRPTPASSTCSSGPSSIVESTQLWWSVRPHHSFGTVEVRICDAQSDGEESFALAGLMIACVAQAALDYDAGALAPPLPGSRDRGEPLAGDPLRARRPDDRLRPRRRDRRRRRRSSELLDWTAPAREQLGIELEPAIGPNGAQRSRADARGTARRSPRSTATAVELTARDLRRRLSRAPGTKVRA